jgi:TetR/AcrR family transcriptional regulator, tetracycline repressor protein
VVQAALDLLDEVGLDALSMRRLAEKLSIKAASLYWHVRDKDHLLALLAEEIVAPTQPPDPALPWRDQIEALGWETRRILLAHRDAARVLAASGAPTGPNRLRLVEVSFGVLMRAGFTPADTAFAGYLLNDFVTLFVAEEAALADQARETDSEAAHNWVAMLPADQYPNLIAAAGTLTGADAEERFRFGMEVLLDGLELRLNRSR